VQVVNSETTGPVLIRAARLAWEYQTVALSSAADVARLNALGQSGWEATGIVAQAEGTTVLLKRPRQP
jgi:hypothetical protein